MKILHLLVSGNIGGIEVLIKDIILKSKEDNIACFMFDEGTIYNSIVEKKKDKVFSLKKLKLKHKIHAIEQYCIKNNIDVIVLHHEGIKNNYIYYALYRKLKRNNVKFVRYMHSAYDGFYNKYNNFIIKKIYHILIQKTLSVSDLIIYISNSVKKSFNDNFRLNYPKECVIYNGIDERFFVNQKEKNENLKNIIYVGRLSKVKGVDILINAIENVRKDNININLDIVGDGQERQSLENMVLEKKMTPNVRFLGRQNNVINFLDQADIFVYPSICEEGFGIAVVEAMSRGCIPVVSNKGGLKEIITNNQDGFILEELTAKCLYRKILDITNLPKEEIIKIRKNAFEKAKKFNINITIEKIEKEFIQLISKEGKNG